MADPGPSLLLARALCFWSLSSFSLALGLAQSRCHFGAMPRIQMWSVDPLCKSLSWAVLSVCWLFPQERDNDLEPLSCHLHVDAAFRLEESSSSTAHLTSSPLGILDTTSAIPLCFAEQKESRQERRTYTQGEGEGWQGEREMSTQRKV